MSSSNEASERKLLSKVNISRIGSEAMVVRIRSIGEDVQPNDSSLASSSFTPIPRLSDAERKELSKFNMTDTLKVSSHPAKQKKLRSPKPVNERPPDSTPCIKHAAENISRKATDLKREKLNLCHECSKSMLSYIFVVQDFLDSLAKEIVGDATSECLQCAREEVRNSIAFSSDQSNRTEDEGGQAGIDSSNKNGSSNRTNSKRTRTRSNRQESESIKNGNSFQRQHDSSSQRPQFAYTVSTYQDTAQVSTDVSQSSDLHSNQTHFVPTYSGENPNSTTSSDYPQSDTSSPNLHQNQQIPDFQSTPEQQKENHSQKPNHHHYDEAFNKHEGPTEHHSKNEQDRPSSANHRPKQTDHVDDSSSKNIFRAPMERTQPNYDPPVHQSSQNDQNNNQPVNSSSLYRDDIDGIISTLSNAEREIYDGARNRAGYEGLTESQERLGSSNQLSSQAFVTSCRNNAEAIGCLVVGTSLLLCRTSRTLCVLMSDGVSTAFRSALSRVFHVVQSVRSMDPLGTTKLALLEQPELGITFEKLHVWRLTQFSKCVYLNPDTLVIQNCDDLFNHDELSAVPDIGWPDCFNSGMFVFVPSVQTFWQLMEHAEKQGSYDGGDQGLLNSYFTSWSTDINKKLSFIYNLMANVSYTYTPAFNQFGRNIKIVQFHGSFKPWHVKFFTRTGQVSPSSPVHPTYLQFVHIWLNIFRISVLRLMSEEIQSYAASHDTICAVEILRFFPLPTESEADFFLTPPSVRLRLTEKKLSRSVSLPMSEANRRKSAEFIRYVEPDEDKTPERSGSSLDVDKDSETHGFKSEANEPGDLQTGEIEANVEESDAVFKDKEVIKEKVKDPNTIPGAEVGDYQGMKAWEQGRIDYEGSDSSDNVLRRLDFLMSRRK